jgi:oxygen-independent coproporphyrinogen-3 oxidase
MLAGLQFRKSAMPEAIPMHAHTAPIAEPFNFHDYLDAVAHLPPQETRPLSLRLHIPAFGRAVAAGEALANYLSYLKREVAMHAVMFTGMSTVRQLGFEGASPSCLADRQLSCLITFLREHFRFMSDEAGDYEVAVDPAALPAGRLSHLRRHGFNRIRFELPPAPGSLDHVGTLAQAARDAGFRSVGVGLPYGVPGQGFDSLRRLLELALAAAPDRIQLCHRPGDTVAGPTAGSIAQRMQQLCSDRLDMSGYTALGADRFALLPGCAGSTPRAAGQPHFPGTHLVGCGVAAASSLGKVSWQNVAPLDDYYAMLDRNQVPVAHGRRQTRPYLMQVKDFQDADQ